MKKTILIKGKNIEYTIIKKKMKNIRMSVDRDGELRVSAPISTKIDIIESVIRREENWIISKIEEIKGNNSENDIFEKREISIRGRNYYVIFEIGKNNVKIEKDTVIITSRENDKIYIRTVMEKWFREYAREIFYERVRKYSKITGKVPENVLIKDQKRAWGSCSTLGNLNLNWRLILAPDEIIDYVVIHELCHMIHMNHSKEYWDLVEKIVPDYKLKRNWLKINGRKLNF